MTDFQESGLSRPSENLHLRGADAHRAAAWSALLDPVRGSPVQSDGECADLARIWLELCAGEMRFGRIFYSAERCYAVIERLDASVRRPRPVEGRKLAILRRVLMGQSQKSVAIEVGLAPSTVAAMVGTCLRNMGCECRSSSPPILLVMAAHAAQGRGGFPGARLGPCVEGGRPAWVLSVPRPDLRFPGRLSKAETSILGKLVEGESLAEIACDRRTSRRTIANQLAALFRKAGVSGRAALLGAIVGHASQPERGRLS